MSEFLIDEDSPNIPTKDKPKTPRPPRTNRQDTIDKLIKMFRAACNGKNYYKKWFPEYKDTGDFAAGFAKEVNKLK